MDVAAPASYTRDEMVRAARKAGFSPSGRLLTDWVSLGLLDQATRRGLGRGRGTKATWPQEQLNLFLAVLDKRLTVSHISPLCNIPVFLWLWFGDEFVPTRQARRALMTWGGANRHSSSWRAARTAAVNLAGQFAHPDADEQARERFIAAIASATYGAPFNAEAVLAAFREVFDPHGANRSIGPPQVMFRPEYFVALVKARLAALDALRAGSVDDDAFEWARTEYRVSRREYEQLIPRIAEDPEAAEIFFRRTAAGVVVPDTTLDDVANHACADLLTLIGIYLENVIPGNGSAPTA
jgi:hypothetical protein